MLDPRLILGRAVLILALVGGATVQVHGSGDVVRFIEPTDGAMVAGPCAIRFAVGGGQTAVDRIDVYIERRLIGSAFGPDWVLNWPEERTLRGETLTAVGYADGAIAGRTSIRARNFGGIQRVQVELVQLYPVVRDGRNRYVRGLEKKDFAVYENGSEVPLEHCESEVNSLNIALLLDVSRFMESKLGRVQDASIQFADQLDSSDALALYAFNQRVHKVVPLTRDHEQVRGKIWYLRASGGTALYDGLREVVEDISEAPGRKAVVVFSDGQDELSLASLFRVAREATSGEVIVYAVGAGGDAGTTREDLAHLTSQSGGKAFFIDHPRELADVYREIKLHLKSQYLLSYVPPPGPEEVRRIEVKVRDRGYDVKCRKSYHFAPPAD